MRANTAILLGLLAALLSWLPSCPARISAADLPPPLPRGVNSTEDSPDSAFNNSGGASTNSVQGPSKAELRPVAGSPPLEGNCTTFSSCGNEPRNTSISEGTASHPEGAPQAPLPVNGGSERHPEEEGNGLEAPGFVGNNTVPKDSDFPETNNTLTSKAVTRSSEVPSLEPPLTSSRGRSIGGNEANHVVFADTEDSLESADARVLAKEEERRKGGVRDEHDMGGGITIEDEGEEGGAEGSKRTSEDDLSYHFKEFSRVEFAERDESTAAYVTEKATHVHFSSSKVVSEVYDSDDVVLTSPVTAPSGPEDDHEDEEEEMMEGEAGERSDFESMFTVLPTTGRTTTQIPLNQTHESGNDVTIPSESVIMHINDSSLSGSDVSIGESRATNCTSDECRLTNAIPDSISFVTMAPSTTERTVPEISSTNQEHPTTSNSSYAEQSTTPTPTLMTSTTNTQPSSVSSIAKSTRRVPMSTTESPIKNEVTYNENITALTYDLKANISLTTPMSVKFVSSHSSSIQNTLPLTAKTMSSPMPTARNASESSGTTTQSTGFEYSVTEATPEQNTTTRGVIITTSITITSGSTTTAANETTMGNSELEETTLASESDMSEYVTSSVTDSELTTFPTTFHQDQVTELLIKSMSSTMDSSTRSVSLSDNVKVEMTTEMLEEQPKVNDLEKIVSAVYTTKSSFSDTSESISTPEFTTVVPDDTNGSSAGGTLPVEEEETKIPLVTLTESSEVSGTPVVVDKIVNHTVTSQSPEISTVENANVSSEATEFFSSVTPVTTVALMSNRTSPLPSAETQKATDDEESTKSYKPDDYPVVNDTDVLIRAYPAFVRLWMKISWNEICQEKLQTSLKEAVSKLLSKSTHRTIPTSRVVLLNFDENCSSSSVGSTKSLSPVYFCILAMRDGDQMEQKHESLNEEGKFIVHCDSMLTELFSRIWTQTPEPLVEPLKHIKEVDIVQSNWSADDGMEFPPNPSEDNSGVIAAIGISCVAAVCLLLIGALLLIMRKRQTRFNYGQRCTPVSLDAYSLDSVSVREGGRPGRGQVRNGEVSRGTNGLRKGDGANDWRASKRSYGNPAFEDDDGEEVLLSKPLNFAALNNAALNEEGSLADEFGLIPKKFHKSSMRRKSRRRIREASAAERGEAIEVEEDKDEEGLPEGAEEKNRYANVIPTLSTRVKLSAKPSGPLSTYINANYCRGHKNQEKFYIACQAPLSSTIEDFWRMIWEQQSKVILMLTSLVENGVEKCADYLPPSEVLDCHRLFGDYQVTLKKRDVREKYIVSSLQLKDMESNLWREVTHLWFLGWPATGVPEEPNQIIAFLIEARPYIQANTGPTVVHCSPGTGRTGTVIAIDICIRDFEQNRMVDVPKVVQQLRRDREGSVQTQQQYAFIYEALSLYATKLTGGAMDSF